MDGRAGGTGLVHEVLADLKIRPAFFFSDTFCISSVLSVFKLMNVAFLEFYANDASKIRTDEYKVKALNLLTQPASPEMNSSECVS